MKTSITHRASLRQGPPLKVSLFADGERIKEVQVVLRKGNQGNLEWELHSNSRQPLLEKLIAKWMDSFSMRQEPNVVLPVDLDKMPPYTLRVLNALKQIPLGTSVSYQELAHKTGCPKGARAVGNACGRNPCPLIVPCHRVLSSAGLGGFSCGIEIKKALLEFEGINF